VAGDRLAQRLGSQDAPSNESRSGTGSSGSVTRARLVISPTMLARAACWVARALASNGLHRSARRRVHALDHPLTLAKLHERLGDADGARVRSASCGGVLVQLDKSRQRGRDRIFVPAESLRTIGSSAQRSIVHLLHRTYHRVGRLWRSG